MIKLGKRSIRLSVTSIIEDLIRSTFTIDEPLKTHASASEIILDVSYVRDIRQRRDVQTYSSIFVSYPLIIETSFFVKSAISTTAHPGTLDMARTCK
jgi:hypothetical protein